MANKKQTASQYLPFQMLPPKNTESAADGSLASVVRTNSRMGLILDISPKVLEKVLYFASYIVLDAGKTELMYKQVLSEKEYQDMKEKYPERMGIGVGRIPTAGLASASW